jgi:hypothetical protein
METKIKYLFEKDGKWLTKDGKMTTDANNAMASNNEIEANLFLIGKHNQGLLIGFEVTEHMFIND